MYEITNKGKPDACKFKLLSILKTRAIELMVYSSFASNNVCNFLLSIPTDLSSTLSKDLRGVIAKELIGSGSKIFTFINLFYLWIQRSRSRSRSRARPPHVL